VPVTLQTLPVLMAAAAVGPYRATAGVLLYTGLGFAGVPLFAASGGATLGYLAGFALVPAVMARMERPLLSVLAGTAVIFACGAAWLSFYVGGLGPALLLGVAPFLPGALVKGMVAYKGILWFRRQQ
jgi:biotin transport system substrate-specific component